VLSNGREWLRVAILLRVGPIFPEEKKKRVVD
jgi:hypothetical protein